MSSLSWVRCGTRLYRFLIFALLLTLYVNRFTIGSQFLSLNISAEVVLKSECNIIRTARFWSLDILSRFDEEVVTYTTEPLSIQLRILDKTFLNVS